MATFTVNGYQMRSNSAHVVEDVQQSELQFVSALGMSTLACNYAQSRAGNAEVALADYNLILNGTHLNDGQLPERIELFDLTWGIHGGSYVSRVLNLAFKEAGGWRDEVFAVDQSPLPSLVSATQANAFLGASRFSLVDTKTNDGTFEIRLDQMPDVDIRGVLLTLFEAAAEDEDSFTFLQEFDATLAQSDFADVETAQDRGLAAKATPQPFADPTQEVDTDANLPDPNIGEFDL